MKDRIPLLSKSYIIYEFTCPGCCASYIGLTKRTLFQRAKVHSSRDESAIKSHLENCSNCEHLFSINNLFSNSVNPDDFRLNLVHNNTRIIDSGNWDTLECKDFFIKERTPLINFGLKASKVFQLFQSVLHLSLYYCRETLWLLRCLRTAKQRSAAWEIFLFMIGYSLDTWV